MPILVDVVRVNNFRSIRKLEIKLTPLTLLAGANNSGKTSFLKAINLALGIERRIVLKEDFNISVDDGDEVKEINIDVRIIPVDPVGNRVPEFDDLWRDVEFNDLISFDEKDNQFVAFRTKVLFNALKNDYEIKKFRINAWSDDPADWEKIEYKDQLRGSFPSIPLFFIDAQRDILEDIRNRTSYLGRMLSKVRIDPKKVEELESKIKLLNDEIVGNSEILSHLKDRLNELNNTIQSGSTGVDITPVNKKIRDLNKGININFQDGKNESFPLEYHGMGTRSWASLLTFKAYVSWISETFEKGGTNPYHPILALEEPETHLHPNAQRHLYAQLRNINGQKIISSHSPYVAGQCELKGIRHFYKTNDNPQVSSFNFADLFKEDIRKLQRQIMHSRGELLFSRAIVLFEGETEEQGLPLFAKEYWDCHPFEMGINFVGIGGSGNYLPFIRFCESFHIPWFILSDGDDNAVKAVKAALSKIKKNIANCPNIKIIEKKHDFEKMLIEEGYQAEIKKGIIQHQSEYFNSAEQKAAKTAEINSLSDQHLLGYMHDNKASVCCDVVESILQIENPKKRFPSTIKQLLDEISQQLGLEISSKYE